MQIEVKENRSLRIYEAEQTQNENAVTIIELTVPEKYEEFNKKIVFILPYGEKVWDIIENNEYTVSKAITKYKDVKLYIWLTKDEEDFRSETEELHFYPNEDASKTITPEEIGGVNKVIQELEHEKEKVEQLEIDVNMLVSDIEKKIEEGAFDGKDALINGYNTIEIIEGENIHINQVEDVLTISADQFDDTAIQVHLNSLDELVDQNTKNITNVTNRATNNTERLDEKDTQIANINQEIETAKERLDGHDSNIETINTSISDINTAIEDMEGELTQDIARVEEIANSAYDLAEEAEIIAKGRATGYVFDTYNDMQTALQDSEFVAKLVLGDNLYIRETDVPDYWWDGTSAQLLETQKVDLAEYVKDTDYATTSSVGLVKPRVSYGSNTDSAGTIYATTRTIEQYNTDPNSLFIGKGTLENVIEGKKLIDKDYVDNAILNSLEKTETWLSEV